MAKTWKLIQLIGASIKGWWSAMSGWLSIPCALASFHYVGLERQVYAGFAFVMLGVFGVSQMFRNRAMIETHKKELDESNAKSDELKNEIKKLTTPLLKVDAVVSNIAKGKHSKCHIRITNLSPAVTADNVRVELLALEDELDEGERAQHFRPSYPYRLVPDKDTDPINPGGSILYKIFFVTVNDSFTCSPLEDHPKCFRNVAAFFTEEVATRPIINFIAGENYRMKLRVTARDIPMLESEFNICFVESMESTSFTLTPV